METGETVAIKKVLQDKRYKNRELQTMRLLDHPNIVSLKHCFFSTTEKDELYLNLVLEYVPETVHRVIKHYSKMNQRMPLIYVKLYSYQVCFCTSLNCFMPFSKNKKNERKKNEEKCLWNTHYMNLACFLLFLSFSFFFKCVLESW